MQRSAFGSQAPATNTTHTRAGGMIAGMAPARKKPQLTSLEGWGFGAGWEWVDTDAEIVRRLVVFLEAKRALSNSYDLEVVDYVIESVIEIRDELTATLRQLDGDAGAARALRLMRESCNGFLTAAQRERRSLWPDFFVRLGELRGVFALYLGALCAVYDVEVHGPLAEIVAASLPDR